MTYVLKGKGHWLICDAERHAHFSFKGVSFAILCLGFSYNTDIKTAIKQLK